MKDINKEDNIKTLINLLTVENFLKCEVLLSFFNIEKESLTDLLTRKEINNEIKIIDEIKNNPKVTAEKLSEILKINVRNIKKNIAKLKERNKIERIGSNKTGYWRVNE